MAKEQELNLVFFDGVCNLCNSTVNLLIKIDKKRRLKYSSLQGEYRKSLGQLDEPNTVDSIIFLTEGRVYLQGEAIVHILIKLGGVYQVLGRLLSAFPLFVLNKLYDLIARNRYSLFGKRDLCRIPSNDIKDRFIP
ncbi:MAG: DCC1-like thiol-disulfide oxidoreductase family protein [Bdellovibrionota bacterium]